MDGERCPFGLSDWEPAPAAKDGKHQTYTFLDPAMSCKTNDLYTKILLFLHFLWGCSKIFVIPYCCLIKRDSHIIAKILAGIIIPYNHQPSKGFEQCITMLNSIFSLRAGAILSVLVDFPDAHPGWTGPQWFQSKTLHFSIMFMSRNGQWIAVSRKRERCFQSLAVEFPYVACFVFRLSLSLPLSGSKDHFFNPNDQLIPGAPKKHLQIRPSWGSPSPFHLLRC